MILKPSGVSRHALTQSPSLLMPIAIWSPLAFPPFVAPEDNPFVFAAV